MLVPPVVSAHQGGWDEALMLLTPVGLLVGLVWVASVRARNHDQGDGTGSGSPR